MANDLTITETATWPATVKLIDIDEAVIGGVDGVSNGGSDCAGGPVVMAENTGRQCHRWWRHLGR